MLEQYTNVVMQIACTLRASFPQSSRTVTVQMINNEEEAQLVLLNHFRQGSDPEVDELKQWLSTRDGAHGWRIDL